MPEIEKGLARSGRSREDFTLATAVFVIPTDDAKQAQAADAFVRQQLSFYMSTPAYRTVLALHGWEETSAKLSELARHGQWEAMPKLISDEIVEAFSVSGTWAELPGRIEQRYGNLIDRISYYLPFIPGENEGNWRASIVGFKNGTLIDADKQ